MKILIVEDQCAESLENAVNRVMPQFFPEFDKSYDMAKWYTQAERFIEENSYDMVLLDHRMPYGDPGCTDKDFDKYCQTLQNIGYGLIPLIRQRNPKAIIIGTSSLDEKETKKFPRPDCTMSKLWGEALKDLEAILNKVGGKQNEKRNS